jgi:hypothetical protein
MREPAPPAARSGFPRLAIFGTFGARRRPIAVQQLLQYVRADVRWGRLQCTRKALADMAIGFYFRHEGFTPDTYDQAIKALDAAGLSAPDGRTQHYALESGGEIQVFDIWESQEKFEAFGATLIPILTDLGVTLGEPMAATVHNEIRG